MQIKQLLPVSLGVLLALALMYLTSVISHNRQLATDIDRLSADVEAKVKMISMAKGEVDEIKEQLDKQVTRNTELLRSVREAEDALQKATAEHKQAADALRSELADSHHDFEELNALYNDTIGECDEKVEKLIELQARVTADQEEVATCHDRLDEANMQAEVERKLGEGYLEKLEALQEENAALRASVGKMLDEAEEQHHQQQQQQQKQQAERGPQKVQPDVDGGRSAWEQVSGHELEEIPVEEYEREVGVVEGEEVGEEEGEDVVEEEDDDEKMAAHHGVIGKAGAYASAEETESTDVLVRNYLGPEGSEIEHH